MKGILMASAEVTEFQPKRTLSYPMKDKPETLIQPTMGVKWNSGSLP